MSLSSDVYQRKVPFVVYCHNSKSYDAAFLLRALIQYGAAETIRYTYPDGVSLSLPLLEGTPNIVFKSENEPISITFKFKCPFRRCVCAIPRRVREQTRIDGIKAESCPFQRRVRFLDSCLITQSSLSGMIEDLHRVAASTDLSTKDAFPHTYRYAMTQGFSEEQFLAIARGKFHMPYEICSSAAVMRDIKRPPTPDRFASVLRGTTGLTAMQMQEFNEIWRVLDIQNLFELQKYYVACDTNHLADTLTYHLNELHRITGLWPSHFITLASQALSSALYNCNDPQNPAQKIFLPFLSSEIYQKFEQALIGGYSVNSAYFSYFNAGFAEKDGQLSDTITSASLVDFNGLYPSALQTELPYRDFVLLQKEDNSAQFRYISEQLKKMNIAFFVEMATREKKSFLFEVVLDYNFEDSLGSSIDLGVFPYFKKVNNQELTQDQQDVLSGLSRNCDREPAKLVSAHRQKHHVTDFVDNIAYLVYLHSCRITEVLSIVSFRTAPFLRDYVQQLQDERSRSSSAILARIIKKFIK